MIQNRRRILIGALAIALFSGASLRAESIENRIDQSLQLLNTPQHLQGVNQLEAIIEELKAQIVATPKDAKAHFLLGKLYFYSNRNRESAAHYDRAIELAPDNAEYHFMRGVLSRFMGEPEATAASLKRATELSPQAPHVWFEYGEVLAGLKRFAQAKTAYQRVLDLDPMNAAAMHALAGVLVNEGEDAKAVVQYRKLVEHDPKHVSAQYNLGQSLQTLKEHASALAAFRRVVELAPDDWRARAKVIQNLEALGKRKDREQAHADLLAHYNRNKAKIDATMFCRDQFETKAHKVMVLEYFEFTGEDRVRYSFHVATRADNKPLYRVSLGSYDATHEHATLTGDVTKGNRFCHLDRYFPSGAHETFRFFDGEPTYDKTKALVIKIIEGQIEPESAMIPDHASDPVELER